MILALLFCVAPIVSYGDGITEDDIVVLITEEEFASAQDALAYAYPPDNLYPFVYNGTPPSTWRNIDTTGCIVGQLYVYDEDTNGVTSIGSDTVMTLATTKDHLFYVTDAQTVIVTDYSGSFFMPIYQAKQGTITRVSAFGNCLYFIESGNSVIVLDIPSQSLLAKVSHDTVISAYMFDEDKLMWHDAEGNANYYNLTYDQNVAVEDEAAESTLANTYLAPDITAEKEISVSSEQAGVSLSVDLNSETASVQSSTVVNTVGVPDAYNDVAFPLSNYEAKPGTGYLPDFIESYFTDTGKLEGAELSYAKTYECDAFAKYAHDEFWHVVDWNRDWPSWYNGSTNTADHHWNFEWPYEQAMIDFFMGLSRGSFVRYVSYKDESPENGTHSYVFDGVADSGLGAWHYECNQDKENGVGYQYYTFQTYYQKNKKVHYYVEHVPTESPVCYNSERHTVGCVNCDGCLRQPHTGTITYSKYNTTYHRQSYSCCVGFVLQTHTYSGVITPICTICGQVQDGGVITPITPNKKPGTEVTITQ